jgi:hypothetical protein
MLLFRNLRVAFGELFTERRSQVSMVTLMLLMAAIPVAELGVIREFATLIINGPKEYKTDRSQVVLHSTVFFVGFAITRGLHHLIRFWRVRVFKKGFLASGLQRTHGTASWEWAQSFELSTVTVGLIQVVTFSVLFFFLNVTVAVVNVATCIIALTLVAGLYKRQLANQTRYAAEGLKPGSTPISDRIATRVFAAEFGSVTATTSMALLMIVVLWRTVTGNLVAGDAVVLFLGLRLLYGHLGALAPSVMRFARDSVRRETARVRAETTVLDVAEEAMNAIEGNEGAEDNAPSDPKLSRRRGQLMTHMVMAGQRGQTSEVQELTARLARIGPLSKKERQAAHVSLAFADYMTGPDDTEPVSLMWWPRPFPGNFGDWLSPYVVQRSSGARVQFQPPTAKSHAPNLVAVGSIGRYTQSRSVVVGTGISRPDTTFATNAQYISVRGPLTAQALRRSSGPGVDSFGDPGLLLSRILPLHRAETNGRIALVRDATHADLPLALPDSMDELSVLRSRPAEIEQFLSTLIDYDGVVTSALHVMIACHSYGIPCELVAFKDAEDAVHGTGLEYRDYALGAGLDETVEPVVVDIDLTGESWSERTKLITVSSDKIDEIQDAMRRALKEYENAAREYAEESDDDDDDGDDGT